MKEGFSNIQIIFFTVLGAALFAPMFVLTDIGPFDFWWWMSANLVVLLLLVFMTDREYSRILREDFINGLPRKLWFGVASAVVLYGVFFAGNYLSRQMLPFAGDGIQGVYDFRGDAAAGRILLLMLLVIGPGEELFWRGFLQRHYEARLGRNRGFFAAAALYTAIHALTGNVMLILAALFAGLFWGWMYRRYRSMALNIVSHTAWDIGVFLLFPLN
jgi:membrane protease YdiL (CAAX protease family)